MDTIASAFFCCCCINVTTGSWGCINIQLVYYLKMTTMINSMIWKKQKDFFATTSIFCAPANHQGNHIPFVWSRKNQGMSSVIQHAAAAFHKHDENISTFWSFKASSICLIPALTCTRPGVGGGGWLQAQKPRAPRWAHTRRLGQGWKDGKRASPHPHALFSMFQRRFAFCSHLHSHRYIF